MNAPLAAIPLASPTRAAAELPQAVPAAHGPEDAFGPQLARACHRQTQAVATNPSGSEIRPVGDVAGATTFCPWTNPAGEKAASTQQESGASPASSDEEQPSSSEDGAAVVPPSTENGASALIMVTPLPLRLMEIVPFATGGAPESSCPTSPEVVPDDSRTADGAKANPNGDRVSQPPQKTEKKTDNPSGVPASSPLDSPTAPKADPSKPTPVHAKESSAAPPPAAGIGAALPSQQMNTALEMTKTSGQEEQNLPGVPAGLAHLVPEKFGARSFLPAPTGSTGEPAVALTAFVPPAEVSGTAHGAEEVARVAPVDATEKILALMSSAVVQLRQTGAEDFEVSLHPDKDTEIWLHVSLQSGGAEIQAELRRGDGAAFAPRWQELQERLAQQGVKLGALTTGDESAGQFGNQSGFSSPHRQWQSEAEAAPLSFVTTTTGNHGRSSLAQRSAGRGWETWA